MRGTCDCVTVVRVSALYKKNDPSCQQQTWYTYTLSLWRDPGNQKLKNRLKVPYGTTTKRSSAQQRSAGPVNREIQTYSVVTAGSVNDCQAGQLTNRPEMKTMDDAWGEGR